MELSLKKLPRIQTLAFLIISSLLIIVAFRANTFTFDPFHPQQIVAGCLQQNTTCSEKEDLFALLGLLALGFAAAKFLEDKIEAFSGLLKKYALVSSFIPHSFDPIRKGLRKGIVHPQIYA